MNRGSTRRKIMTTKKKRKPYDDDTNYESKRARLNDGEGEENDISEEMLETYNNRGGHRCDYCQRTADCNKQGEKEELLFCKDCRAKAHPSCMDYSKSLAERARHSPWQCIDCKTCSVCCDSGDPSTMLFCDACDKGYHMECHQPLVAEKPLGKWVCNRCEKETEGAAEKIVIENGASCLPTPSESPVQFDQTSVSLPSKVPLIANVLSAEQIPDAFDWSIEDVVKFFKDVGFQTQAEVFREQEIDGKSLLLLKRSDVLSGLSLKLGPALKIYTHVQRLQNNSKFM